MGGYRLNVVKDRIPYAFEVNIAGTRYRMAIQYNDMYDFFTVDLMLGTEVLVYGEPLRYGAPLFGDYADERFPAFTITPLDPSGQDNVVTWDTLQETVFLEVTP